MSRNTDLLFCLKYLKSKVEDLQKGNEVILTDTFSIKPEDSICSSVPLIAATNHLRQFALFDICSNAYSWPEYSGNMFFPVYLSKDKSYFKIKNKWIKEYGEARIRLLDHLIKELENESN